MNQDIPYLFSYETGFTPSKHFQNLDPSYGSNLNFYDGFDRVYFRGNLFLRSLPPSTDSRRADHPDMIIAVYS